MMSRLAGHAALSAAANEVPAVKGLQHGLGQLPSQSARGKAAPMPQLSHPGGSLQPSPDAGVPRLFCDGLLFPLLRNPPAGGKRLSHCSKAGAAEPITVFYGRSGKPVKKPRFIPAELAHQWARKLQARRLGTVSVL